MVFSRRVAHGRLPAFVGLPLGTQFVGTGPELHGEAGGVGGAERGRFGDLRAHYFGVQDVRLELHERLAAHHAAIDAQGFQRNAGILLHGAGDVVGLVGGGFERGAADMGAVGIAREAGDDAARVGTPMRGVQAREGRHDVDAAIVGHGQRQGIGLGGVTDNAEIVAQPLNERAGDGDRALQRIGGRGVAEAVGDRGDQAGLALLDVGAGIEQQEIAGAVGVLGLARGKADLADEGRLLVTQHTGQGDAIEFELCLAQ